MEIKGIEFEIGDWIELGSCVMDKYHRASEMVRIAEKHDAPELVKLYKQDLETLENLWIKVKVAQGYDADDIKTLAEIFAD